MTDLNSHQQYTRGPISPHPQQKTHLLLLLFFFNSQRNGYEVVPHCGFGLHFPNVDNNFRKTHLSKHEKNTTCSTRYDPQNILL